MMSDMNMINQEHCSAKRAGRGGLGLAVVAYSALWLGMALWPGAARGGTATTPPEATVKELMTRDLIGAAGKEVLMVTVKYLAGGASLPHRHNAQVFVYVLDGKVRMQVKGAAAVTLGPGETFYEGPDDIHTISANASRTKPARILVFIVKDKGAPATSGAGPDQHP